MKKYPWKIPRVYHLSWKFFIWKKEKRKKAKRKDIRNKWKLKLLLVNRLLFAPSHCLTNLRIQSICNISRHFQSFFFVFCFFFCFRSSDVLARVAILLRSFLAQHVSRRVGCNQPLSTAYSNNNCWMNDCISTWYA